MKKIFNFYVASWAVMFVLFQVISFVTPGWADAEKYTPSFWIGYICITIFFFGQLACAYFALKTENPGKVFYRSSLVAASYVGLLLSFASGGFCMLIPTFPYWASIILCAIVLAFNVISIMKASVSVALVECADEKEKAQVFFLKSLTADAETLLSKARSETVKKDCRRVFEKFRYSDPVSCEALAAVEGEITVKFSAFAKAVEEDNAADVKAISEELVILLEDRNKKCKLLK